MSLSFVDPYIQIGYQSCSLLALCHLYGMYRSHGHFDAPATIEVHNFLSDTVSLCIHSSFHFHSE